MEDESAALPESCGFCIPFCIAVGTEGELIDEPPAIAESGEGLGLGLGLELELGLESVVDALEIEEDDEELTSGPVTEVFENAIIL